MTNSKGQMVSKVERVLKDLEVLCKSIQVSNFSNLVCSEWRRSAIILILFDWYLWINATAIVNSKELQRPVKLLLQTVCEQECWSADRMKCLG